MRGLQSHFDVADRLLLFLGTIAGGTITLLAIERLSPTRSALVSAILIACLSFTASELSKPRWWWLCVSPLYHHWLARHGGFCGWICLGTPRSYKVELPEPSHEETNH